MGMSAMAQTSKADIALRRAKVLELRLAGASERSIARELGISNGTAHNDLAAVADEFRAHARQDIEAAKGKQLLRYERLLAAQWANAIGGDREATGQVLAIMAGIAKTLGLDAPLKVNVLDEARELAREFGLDPDLVVREAECILRRGRG
jgi:DNA-binding CsgD family transcriptional regulator